MHGNEWSSQKEVEIFNAHYNKLACKTDRMFAVLFLFQWLLGIVLAMWISPLSWVGNESQIHMHVYAAIFMGGLAAAFPIFCVLTKPGIPFNRYIIAMSQMAFSILLIHLTGGRIETHFHIFGSLAFLAFYRDFWPVLLATIITAADHVLRGMFWPQSVYGVLGSTPFRALEHAGWVIFEDVFLYVSMKNGFEELKTIAKHQVQVESTLTNVEEMVQARTKELRESQKVINEQQQVLVSSAKLSALGEMAGGIAHEINNPLGVITVRASQIKRLTNSDPIKKELIKEFAEIIEHTGYRMAKIVQGLRFFARTGDKDPLTESSLQSIFEDTFALCENKLKQAGIDVKMELPSHPIKIECRPVQLSQVILNLLNNARDAIENLPEKWIKLSVEMADKWILICVSDSGKGIAKNVADKIFQPFFTTKDIGKGTGLGLSISRGIIEDHGGELSVDTYNGHTRFVIKLPCSNSQKHAA